MLTASLCRIGKDRNNAKRGQQSIEGLPLQEKNSGKKLLNSKGHKNFRENPTEFSRTF